MAKDSKGKLRRIRRLCKSVARLAGKVRTQSYAFFTSRMVLKGASAVGGYVSLTGNGRVAKVRFDPSKAELALKNDSEPTKEK